MDRYLPPSSGALASRQKNEVAKNVSNGTEKSQLQQIHLKGAMDIVKLKAHGIETQNVRMNVQGENGVYTIDPWSLRVYQGTVSGRTTVDLQRDVPRSDLSFQAKGIQVGPLLRDLTKKEPLTGVLQAQATLHMEGSQAEQIERSLSGKGDIHIRDGALRGVSLMGVIRKVDAALSFGQGGGSSQTDFSDLNFPFTVSGGVVSTSSASLTAPHLTAAASGRANLTTQALDFRLEPRLSAPQSLKGLGIKGIGENSSVSVPVLVSGTFSSPEFRPDVSGAVQEAVKGEVQKLRPEAAGEALKKGLPGGLRSLWGG
jgi:AsmA protein